MDRHQQYLHLNQQQNSILPTNLSPLISTTIHQQQESRIDTLTIPPIHMNYLSTRPKKHKKAIIHDISTLTRKRKTSIEKPPSQIPNQPTTNRENRSLRQKPLLTLQVLPTQREQLELIRSELRNSQDQEDDYLKHNLGTVKEKIRSKFLKHHVDFAEKQPSNQKKHTTKIQTEPTHNPSTHNPTHKQRIDRYNHEFEQYLIRKRISKKKSYTLPPDSRASHPTCREPDSPPCLQEQMHNSLNVETSEHHHPIPPNKSPLYCSSDNHEAARIIIVSPLNPTHQIARFKNALIDSTRQSYPNNDQHSLLYRFLNRHPAHPSSSNTKEDNKNNTPIRSSVKNQHQPTPINLIKSSLNYSLLKRQIHKVRKQSIALPHLLQGQQQKTNQTQLEEKLNARKISPHMTISPKTPPKKQVVYSKKNLFAAASVPTNPFSEESPESQ